VLILLCILPVVWSHGYIRGRFYNRLITHEEIDFAIFNVSGSKLSTSYSQLAICTISKENRLLNGPDEKLGVAALINGNLQQLKLNKMIVTNKLT
jgi:hypothetical protein